MRSFKYYNWAFELKHIWKNVLYICMNAEPVNLCDILQLSAEKFCSGVKNRRPKLQGCIVLFLKFYICLPRRCSAGCRRVSVGRTAQPCDGHLPLLSRLSPKPHRPHPARILTAKCTCKVLGGNNSPGFGNVILWLAGTRHSGNPACKGCSSLQRCC